MKYLSRFPTHYLLNYIKFNYIKLLQNNNHVIHHRHDRKVYEIDIPFTKGCISVASIEFDGMFVARIDSWNRCQRYVK